MHKYTWSSWKPFHAAETHEIARKQTHRTSEGGGETRTQHSELLGFPCKPHQESVSMTTRSSGRLPFPLTSDRWWALNTLILKDETNLVEPGELLSSFIPKKSIWEPLYPDYLLGVWFPFVLAPLEIWFGIVIGGGGVTLTTKQSESSQREHVEENPNRLDVINTTRRQGDVCVPVRKNLSLFLWWMWCFERTLGGSGVMARRPQRHPAAALLVTRVRVVLVWRLMWSFRKRQRQFLFKLESLRVIVWKDKQHSAIPKRLKTLGIQFSSLQSHFREFTWTVSACVSWGFVVAAALLARSALADLLGVRVSSDATRRGLIIVVRIGLTFLFLTNEKLEHMLHKNTHGWTQRWTTCPFVMGWHIVKFRTSVSCLPFSENLDTLGDGSASWAGELAPRLWLERNRGDWTSATCSGVSNLDTQNNDCVNGVAQWQEASWL